MLVRIGGVKRSDLAVTFDLGDRTALITEPNLQTFVVKHQLMLLLCALILLLLVLSVYYWALHRQPEVDERKA